MATKALQVLTSNLETANEAVTEAEAEIGRLKKVRKALEDQREKTQEQM